MEAAINSGFFIMKYKLLLPDNIFSKILLSELNDKESIEIEYLPSALISKNIELNSALIGLIPTLDLLTFKNFFISSEIGISFNALLSNSYIHFKEGQETISEIFLKGDVASNEVLLSKILFKELYEVDIKHSFVTDETLHQKDNLLIAGDENYEKVLFTNGLSFSEEVIELISAPYVNFILASSKEDILKKFSSEHKKDFENGHSESYENLLTNLPATSIDFISVNMQHVVFDFEDQDLEGIKSLLQLPYYHGFVKDIVEVKYV